MKQWKRLLEFELDGANAFYLLHALWYLPTSFITFPREQTEKFKKVSHLHNLPTSWTKLVTCGKYLLGYDRPSWTSFAKSLNRLFQVQPNYQIMKRMWNALFRRKIVFRFSLQQFETDDGCFFKRRNWVSNLTAQKKLLYNLNLGWSPKFLRKFPYSTVLLSYGSAGRGTCGTHIIYIYPSLIKKKNSGGGYLALSIKTKNTRF